MRTLAKKELRVSVITTKRAYEDLERDGFIETVAGKGRASWPEENAGSPARRSAAAGGGCLTSRLWTPRRAAAYRRRSCARCWNFCWREKSNMNSAIEVRGLCKHYRDFSLRDVSFTVTGRLCHGLYRARTARAKPLQSESILGLLHTDGGYRISVLGRDPVTDRRAIGQDIGVVLDGSFFYEGMRAKDISAVMSRLHSRWDKESFASYCKTVRSAHGRTV